MLSSLLLSLAATATLVNAHGYVAVLTIGGTEYEGVSPYANPIDSVIRQTNAVDPVTDLTTTDLACGRGAKPATLIADAMPGDEVIFKWVSGSGGSWAHLVGPMMTYMAECGGDCTTAVADELKWFKVQEVGKLEDGTWQQADLANGDPAVITLPTNIKAGDYLLRHEVISLQNGQTEGGAELFPSCSQITVGGDGTGEPTAEETVSFPGAYKSSDPGIHYDPYGGETEYTFPGPPVAVFAASKSGSSRHSRRMQRTRRQH